MFPSLWVEWQEGHQACKNGLLQQSPNGFRLEAFGAPGLNWNNLEVITLNASEAAAQCIIIGPVCGFVCVCCLWVCYHDNSKLRASILTKLGFYKVKVVTISSWLDFVCAAPPGRSLRRGEIFWLRLTAAGAQCLRLSERFFHILTENAKHRISASAVDTATSAHAVTAQGRRQNAQQSGTLRCRCRMPATTTR